MDATDLSDDDQPKRREFFEPTRRVKLYRCLRSGIEAWDWKQWCWTLHSGNFLKEIGLTWDNVGTFTGLRGGFQLEMYLTVDSVIHVADYSHKLKWAERDLRNQNTASAQNVPDKKFIT